MNDKLVIIVLFSELFGGFDMLINALKMGYRKGEVSGDTYRLNRIRLELDMLEARCQVCRVHHIILLVHRFGIFPNAKL